MCQPLAGDPTDQVHQAEAALRGLCVLLSEIPPDADIEVRDVSPILDLIHGWLAPAAGALRPQQG